jgi:hypothetical protein
MHRIPPWETGGHRRECNDGRWERPILTLRRERFIDVSTSGMLTGLERASKDYPGQFSTKSG